jgi:tryptophan-rich sensory protein
VALLAIVLLWLAIAFNILVFYWLKPASAVLLVPYLLWVTYASYLNFGICHLNRDLQA